MLAVLWSLFKTAKYGRGAQVKLNITTPYLIDNANDDNQADTPKIVTIQSQPMFLFH